MENPFQACPPNDGERLDRYLARVFGAGLSRAQLHRAIDEGRILLRGRKAAKGTKLTAADAAALEDRGLGEWASAGAEGAVANGDVSLDVVYEDDELVGFCKPAGMPVQPIRPDERETLVNGLLARYPEMAGLGGDLLCPAVLHRIDIATSGLVLAARTPRAYKFLREEFRRFRVKKHYLAVAEGCIAAPGRSDSALVHATRSPCKMRLARPGDGDGDDGRRLFPASTAWTPLAYDEASDRTLLDVLILTGVTHQIRCHLASTGHPLVGDAVYGRGPAAGLQGHALHSWRTIIRHPATGEEISIEAPPPADFPMRPA